MMLPIRKITTSFLLVCLLLVNGLAARPVCAAAPAVIKTTDQGIHKINVDDGQLIIITGIYEDTTEYKRSIALYFQNARENDWQHVPILESKDATTTQWFTTGRGETLLTDAVIVPSGKDVLLIVVDKKPGKQVYKVTRYRFGPSGEDYPDAPAFVFMPQSSKSVNGTKNDTVETILNREAAAGKRN